MVEVCACRTSWINRARIGRSVVVGCRIAGLLSFVG
jgi:hypothetical protein